MDRIQIKASELWDLLFAEETADTYQKTLNLTGTILKEFAQLIWLIICSVFVFGAWFSDTSVRAGKSIRDWVDSPSSDVSAAANPQAVADKGKSLLDTGRTGIAYLLNQARGQLGIEPEEMPAVTRTANAIKPDAKPTTAAATPATPPQPAPAVPSQSAASQSAASQSAASQSAASQSAAPTVTPFSKPAGNPGAANTPAVGSSRGAGARGASSAPTDEIVREDDDGGWGSQDEE